MIRKRRCSPLAFTLIELLVVIGILAFIAALSPLLESALRTANRMRQPEALSALAAALAAAAAEVQDASQRTRAVVIWSLATRQADREQTAELIRQLAAASDQLHDLQGRMEALKPRLAEAEDRQILCDAIETAKRLSLATQRLMAALQLVLLPEVSPE